MLHRLEWATIGDPACDLAIAWTLLTEPGRQTFRDRLNVDDASWARGRGWALWKTLSGLASAIADADDEEAAPLMRVLGELFDEHSHQTQSQAESRNAH